MGFALKSTGAKYLSIGIITLLLSGCGSVKRFVEKDSDIYLGTRNNIEIATIPEVVVYTLGIGSLTVLVTLPVDIAVDTVLLPADVVIAYQRKKRLNVYFDSIYRLSVISVNLINPKMQISYTIKYPTFAHFDISNITTYRVSSTIGPIDQDSKLHDDLPFAKNAKSLSIDWRLSEPYKGDGYNSTKSKKLKPQYAYSVNEEVPLPELNQQHSALVVIFMPCYQTMIVPITHLQSVETLIEMPEIQQRYQEFLQLDKEKRCVMPPSFSQVPF